MRIHSGVLLTEAASSEERTCSHRLGHPPTESTTPGPATLSNSP